MQIALVIVDFMYNYIVCNNETIVYLLFLYVKNAFKSCFLSMLFLTFSNYRQHIWKKYQKAPMRMCIGQKDFQNYSFYNNLKYE